MLAFITINYGEKIFFDFIRRLKPPKLRNLRSSGEKIRRSRGIGVCGESRPFRASFYLFAYPGLAPWAEIRRAVGALSLREKITKMERQDAAPPKKFAQSARSA